VKDIDWASHSAFEIDVLGRKKYDFELGNIS